MGKFIKVMLFVAVTLMVPSFASAAVIFQDNFDSCTQNCMAAQLAAPPGWGQWMGPGSASVGGTMHYDGEITSPGRGGTGKSFKTWRAGTYWTDYNGTLLYDFTGSDSNIYMRYYVKWPTAMDLRYTEADNIKLWRFNYGAGKELYLNINGGGPYIRNGALKVYQDSTLSFITILDNANLRAALDGNWHCWEWHINLSTGVLEFWLDGVNKYSASNWNFGGGTFDMMQHFSMGNAFSGTWQPDWQAMDIDDFVLSTSYVGPDGTTGGGTTPPPTDTTTPVISNPQPSATLGAGTVSTTMRVTTNENATCKYGTTNTTYASLPNTFTTTGGTTHSRSLTGLTNGSSATYYVRCQDSSGNASTASTPITVAVSNTPPSTSGIFFQDNFDNNCSGNSCNSSGGTSLVPSGWMQWYAGGTTATADGITHYSGEISSTGRLGTAKSLKLWRHSGVFGDYTGGLAYDFSKSTNNLFMRYYLKIPTAFDGTDEEFKSWRMNLAGGGEIYLHFKGCGNSCRSNGVWTIHDGVTSVTALNNADLRAIWDGNWHSVEWELGLGTRTLKLWIDGVLKYNNTNKTWSSSQPFDFMQHFPIGNTFHPANGTWQSTWQALEVDDLAFSTSYIGPIGGSTPPPSGGDTTPPAVPTGLSVL